MTREIAADLGMPSGTVREQLVIGEANTNRQKATITVKGKRIPLIDFRHTGVDPSRGRGRGVTVKIGPPAKGRYPHAFLATMPSGHQGIFERTAGKFMRQQRATWKKKRQAIHELRAPSMSHVFAKYIPIGIARGEEALVTNLEHEMQFAMRSAAV